MLLIPKNICATNSAVATPKISCVSVVTTPKSTVELPVYVSNNPGIMGLGLEVSFDASVMELLEVKAGEVFSEGILNDSIGTSDSKGEVKILWSSTKDVKEDGELVRLFFEVKSEEEGSNDIKLYCSAPDTFNENWKDVSFVTENATVRVKAEITEEYIKEADVTASLKKEEETENELKNTEIESTQAVSTETTKSKASVGQTDAKQTITQQEKELDRIRKAAEIKAEVEEKSDTNTAKAEIEKVLKEYNAETPKDVKEEDKQEFTQRINAVLYQKDIHTDDVLENESTDGKIEVLTTLYDDLLGKQSVERAEKQVLEETGKTKVSVRYVIGLVALVVVAILVVEVRHRKFTKGEKRDERNK